MSDPNEVLVCPGCGATTARLGHICHKWMPVPTPVKTLRDELAMAALTGMLSEPDLTWDHKQDKASHAYEFADAMLKAREEP